METTFKIFDYSMWFFVAVFLVVGILSFNWDTGKGKRILIICTIVAAVIVFLISIVKLFLAIEMEKDLVQFIFQLAIWLYAIIANSIRLKQK